MLVLVFWLGAEEKEGFVPICKLSFTSRAERDVAQPLFSVKKHSLFD